MRGPIQRGYLLAVALAAASLWAQAGQVDWPEVNPALEGATFVKDPAVCAECHKEAIDAFHETAHGRAFEYGTQAGGMGADCETCHGPRSRHVDDPEAVDLTFTAAQYSAVCLQCHQDARRMNWQGSLHRTAEVGCTTCHAVMEGRSPASLLSAASQLELCGDCHAEVIAEARKSSHHPIREGRLDCSSCHNPHGAPGQAMLVEATANETCYGCHQDKRGPFLWEHAPVREDCLTCHTPHGSNNPDLLRTLGASQCVTCHQYGGHVNEFRYNRVSTPYGDGCVNCHVTVHGSNHPSGARFTR